MKIAILGGNSFGHFLCQKLLEDDRVTKIYQLPSNPSLYPTSRFVPLDIIGKKTIEFLENEDIDLYIPIALPQLIWKELQELIRKKNKLYLMPTYSQAHLEWSKIEGKKLLNHLNIPTTNYQVYKREELLNEFLKIKKPFVIKYERDWRAGLQTIIVNDKNFVEEYENIKNYGNLRYMPGAPNFFDQHFIVEEFLEGSREYSYHAISNKVNWRYLGSARDYKKFQENDLGFNTAGMGSYSPVNINPKVHEYAEKIFSHLKETNNPYIGFLYLGIMEDKNGNPYVLEINTRPGDPEMQSILMTHDSSYKLLDILVDASENNLIKPINFTSDYGVSIRIVHSDYRDFIDNRNKKVDYYPHLWPEDPEIFISYGYDNKQLHSILTTNGSSKINASKKIYEFLKNKEMFNYTYRKDIGYLE